MKTLEERIDEAHRKGDKRTLEKLQAEYRARGNPVIRYSSLPPVLVEPNSTRPHGAPCQWTISWRVGPAATAAPARQARG